MTIYPGDRTATRQSGGREALRSRPDPVHERDADDVPGHGGARPLFSVRHAPAAGRGRRRGGLTAAPRGAQNFAEFVVEALLNLVEGTIGKATGRRIFPLIATLFLFILTSNLRRAAARRRFDRLRPARGGGARGAGRGYVGDGGCCGAGDRRTARGD
jgi:hypothetical protein